MFNWQTTLEIPPFSVYFPECDTTLLATSAFASINLSSIKDIDFIFRTTLKVPNTEKILQDLVGDSLDLSVNAHGVYDHTHKLYIPKIHTNLKSDYINLNSENSMTDYLTKLSFISPVNIEIIPSPEILNDIFQPKNKSVTYIPYVPASININVATLDLTKPIFTQFVCSGDLSLSKLDLVNKIWFQEFTLDSIQADFSANSITKKFFFDSSMRALSKNISSGLLKCELKSNTFDSLSFYKNHLQSTLQLQEFSTGLADTMFGYEDFFAIILGNQVAFEINSTRNKDLHHHTASIESEKLLLKTDFYVDDMYLWLSPKPTLFEWKITEKTYSNVVKNFFQKTPKDIQFHIDGNSFLEVKLNDLRLPKQILTKDESENLVPLHPHFFSSFFDVNLVLSDLQLISHMASNKAELSNMKLKLTKEKQDSPFNFSLLTNLKDLSDSNVRPGSVVCDGKINLSKNSPGVIETTIDAQAADFPNMIADGILKLCGIETSLFATFLGKNTTADAHVKLAGGQGIAKGKIRSSQASGEIDLSIKNKVATLNKPIQASLEITPELSSYLLENMGVTLERAYNPLMVYIDDKDFSVDLDNYSISKVNIARGVFDLGKIECTNRGAPETVAYFLKQYPTKKNRFDLWFAPLRFSLHNANLYIDRTEFLFKNSYELAFWGNVNLKKRYVDMILGVTSQALNQALGIKGLPRDFVLQVPFEGPIGNVSIDKEIAATRIAFLVARSSGLTKQAGVWGNVIDLFGEMANEQSRVPPVQKPLPWEGKLSKLIQEEESHTKVHIIR